DSETDVYYLFKKFADKFVPNFDDDMIIANLLTAIILFNPNRKGLTHKISTIEIPVGIADKTTGADDWVNRSENCHRIT
ncbi:unnamed protein product, partial [Medioppia subpectinata]